MGELLFLRSNLCRSEGADRSDPESDPLGVLFDLTDELNCLIILQEDGKLDAGRYDTVENPTAFVPGKKIKADRVGTDLEVGYPSPPPYIDSVVEIGLVDDFLIGEVIPEGREIRFGEIFPEEECPFASLGIGIGEGDAVELPANEVVPSIVEVVSDSIEQAGRFSIGEGIPRF
jgi:hypothetical protein